MVVETPEICNLWSITKVGGFKYAMTFVFITNEIAANRMY